MFVCMCRRNSHSARQLHNDGMGWHTGNWLPHSVLAKRGQLKKPSAVEKPHGLMPRGQFKPQCSSSFNWSNRYIGLSHSLTQAIKSSYTSFCFKQDTKDTCNSNVTLSLLADSPREYLLKSYVTLLLSSQFQKTWPLMFKSRPMRPKDVRDF